MDDIKRRATVHDVAREAGVSLATVDRVLNGRPGVRTETARKVETAIRVLDFRRDLSASLLARARDLNVRFVIPDSDNAFMQSLVAAIGRRMQVLKGERIDIVTQMVPPFDGPALSEALDRIDPLACDCAVVVATEDDVVRDAIERASRRGIAVVTLVSDFPGSARRHFVGVDNVAAGRTAASLVGRFCSKGKVGVIAGALSLADHHERREGFEAVLRSEYPALDIIGPIESRDDDDLTAAAARQLIDAGAIALYNLGAGNAGLMSALEAAGVSGQLRVVAHELTSDTRRGLESGAIDVVIDQNPDGEIASALVVARTIAMGQDPSSVADGIEIGLFMRDNLR